MRKFLKLKIPHDKVPHDKEFILREESGGKGEMITESKYIASLELGFLLVKQLLKSHSAEKVDKA